MTRLDDWRLRGAAIALALGFPLWSAPEALAQTSGEPVAAAEAEPAVAADEAAVLLTDEELDNLVAPVALYPDPLLAQIFVASTYPLEVVKADRWVKANVDLAVDQRAATAEAEGWDPSVAVLAAGFPNVVERMATDIDHTENLGDAMLTQSDDVLDAVQRQRARANAVGNLESNEAQTVTVEGDNITIAPASPQVIYVPTYDPQTVYVTPAPAAPVVVETTTGYSSGDLLMTGVLAFGAGMLVNEIFDDDDDWHGYWGPGYRHFGWDDDYFYPRPGWGGHNDIDVDIGEINIDRSQVDIDHEGRWQPDKARSDEARQKMSDRRTPERAGDRQPTTRDRERTQMKDKLGARQEGVTRDLKRSEGKTRDLTKPAQAKTQTRGGAFDTGGANLTQTRKAAERGKQSKATGDLQQRASGGGGDRSAKASPSVSKSKAAAKPQRKQSSKGSAFSQHSGGGAKAKASKSRGSSSMTKRRG